MAGGKGTRLLPYTKVIPKPLMPIGDMPILKVLVRQLKYARVDEIILSVNHLASLLHAFFENGEKVAGYPFSGYWKDLGRIDDYEQAIQDFETMRPTFLKEETL